MSENTKLSIAGGLVVLALAFIGYLYWPVLMGGDDPNPTKQQTETKKQGQTGGGKKIPTTAEENKEKTDDKVIVNTDKEKTGPIGKTVKPRDLEIKNGPKVSTKGEAEKVISKEVNKGASKGTAITVSEASKDQYGNTIFRAQQTYKGVPIVGATSVLVVKGGKAQNVFGHWTLEKIDLEVKPTFEAEASFRAALTKRGVPTTRNFMIDGTPKLYVMLFDKGARLVWLLDGNLKDPDSEPSNYVVDAHKPEILYQQTIRMH